MYEQLNINRSCRVQFQRIENPHLWFEIVPLTGEYEIRGSTPAEKTGIKIEGSNKWLTLIRIFFLRLQAREYFY